MRNELYQVVIVSAVDNGGESPIRVVVTEEANGFAVWYDNSAEKDALMLYCRHRDRAIEYGVRLGESLQHMCIDDIARHIEMLHVSRYWE